MILSRCLKVRSLILATALISGLDLSTDASAQENQSFLIDLNSGTATALGTLGGDYSKAYGINDVGQVVGWSDTAQAVQHAFITGPDGVGMRDLGTLGGNFSRAYGINDAGQVVGESSILGRSHAFVTGPDGMGMRDLGTLGGSEFNRSSQAYGINAAGQVVGDTVVPGGVSHAFITDPSGAGMRDLGNLGHDVSQARDINDAGQVVGSIDFGVYAFITGPDGMGMRDLGTLGAINISSANGINDAGQVVGASLTAEGPEGRIHAFITGADGAGMRDLGTLMVGTSIEYFSAAAYDINEAGQVVGWSQTAEGLTHAFITGPDGMGMTDLNSLVDLPEGIILVEARGINNAGQVIAGAMLIPEPETYALMLAGLGLIALRARRKKKHEKEARG